MNRALLVLAIPVVVLAVWEIFAPVDYTLSTRLGAKLGAFEAAWIAEREANAASQAKALADAEAEVQRMTTIVQQAVALEAEIARKQAQSVHSTQYVTTFAANVADLGCVLSKLDDSGELAGTCQAASELRRELATQFPDAVDNTRSTMLQDMLEQYRAGAGQ